jgi:hypothetical protein
MIYSSEIVKLIQIGTLKGTCALFHFDEVEGQI